MGSSAIDLVGQRFGKLLVISRAGTSERKKATWNCRCDCGTEVVTVGQYLRCGDTTSCGCACAERLRAIHSTHGLTRRGKVHPLFVTWRNMRDRCSNPMSTSYPYYGARGISVCARWSESFPNFLADVGDRPSRKHSLDRIDPDGDYEPGNVRWASALAQARNRDNVRKITLGDATRTVTEWAAHLGLPRTTIAARIARGLPLDRVFQK